MQSKPPKVSNILTAHPATVGEGYWQHFRFALRFSALLAYAAFAACVHALLPFCFENTAGRVIRRMAAEMDARH